MRGGGGGGPAKDRSGPEVGAQAGERGEPVSRRGGASGPDHYGRHSPGGGAAGSPGRDAGTVRADRSAGRGIAGVGGSCRRGGVDVARGRCRHGIVAGAQYRVKVGWPKRTPARKPDRETQGGRRCRWWTVESRYRGPPRTSSRGGTRSRKS